MRGVSFGPKNVLRLGDLEGPFETLAGAAGQVGLQHLRGQEGWSARIKPRSRGREVDPAGYSNRVKIDAPQRAVSVCICSGRRTWPHRIRYIVLPMGV